MKRALFKLGGQAQITPIKPLVAPEKGGDEEAAPKPFPNGPQSLGGAVAGSAGGTDAVLQQQAMGQALDEQGKQVQDAQSQLQQTTAELESTKMQLQGMQQTHDLEKQQLTAQIDATAQQGQNEAQQAKNEAETVKQQAKAQIEAAKIEQKLHSDASKMQQKIQVEAQKAQKDLQAAQQPEGVSPALQEQASRALKKVTRIGQGVLKMAVTAGGQTPTVTKPPGQQSAPGGQTNPNPAAPAVVNPVKQPVTTPGAQPAAAPVPAASRQQQPAQKPTTQMNPEIVPQGLEKQYSPESWKTMSAFDRRQAQLQTGDAESQARAAANAKREEQIKLSQPGQGVGQTNTLGDRISRAGETGETVDLFDANNQNRSLLGRGLRHVGNFGADLFGARGYVTRVAANDDVSMRQNQLARNMGLDPADTGVRGRMGGWAAQQLNHVGNMGRRLGLYGQKALAGTGVLMTGGTAGDWDKSMEGINAKLRGLTQQEGQFNGMIDRSDRARAAYQAALNNEGINYNTGLNNAFGALGAGVQGAATIASGGVAGAGSKALAVAKPLGMSLGGAMLTPGYGVAQQGVQMNPYDTRTGQVSYAQGHAPSGYVPYQPMYGYSGYKGAAHVPSIRNMVKRAVLNTPTQSSQPATGAGFMLNQVGGYASNHPGSPYGIGNAANDYQKWMKPWQKGLMNYGVPVADLGLSMFGLPTLTPKMTRPLFQGAQIQTGVGSTLPPLAQMQSMGLNQQGLPDKA